MHFATANSLLLVLGTLPCQIFIQLFLHIVGHFSCYGADYCIGHTLGESNDKVDIVGSLAAAHNCGGIVAVVDGGCVAGCPSGKGNSGNPLIRKGRGVRGVHILVGVTAETKL